MDNLGRAMGHLDKALGELDRTAVIRSRMPIVALRLAAAGVLALVDMAVSLRVLALGIGRDDDADNKT